MALLEGSHPTPGRRGLPPVSGLLKVGRVWQFRLDGSAWGFLTSGGGAGHAAAWSCPALWLFPPAEPMGCEHPLSKESPLGWLAFCSNEALSNFHSEGWKLEIEVLAGKDIWWFSTHVWAQHSFVQTSAAVGHNRTCWYPLPWWIELIHRHNRLECLLSPMEAITLKQVYSLLKIYYVKTYLGSSLKPGFLCPFKTLGLYKKSPH